MVVLGNLGLGTCPYTNPKFEYRGVRITEKFVDYARWQYKTGCWGDCQADEWAEINATECMGVCPESTALMQVKIRDALAVLANRIISLVVFGYTNS